MTSKGPGPSQWLVKSNYEIVKNRLGGKTLLHVGFAYNFHRQNKNSSVWRCVNKRHGRCGGSVKLNEGNNVQIQKGHKPECQPDLFNNEIKVVMNDLKKEVTTNFSSIKKMFEMKTAKLQGYSDKIPIYNNVKQAIYRSRNTALKLRIANVMACSEKQISSKSIKYLNQTEAITLDEQLFNDYKYSVDQLMELAGLSVATAVARVFPSSTHERALIICGPGNNGGDGLVAARHMSMFGYKVAIHYPIRKPNQLYERLLEQATRFNVDLVERLSAPKDLQNDYELLVDALFGFSFKPPVRPKLQPALDALITSGLPVCSVDIPSGWHVENGPESQHSLKPALLISLSAPKMCAKPEYLKSARHFLGGRFLPPSIIKSFNLSLPPYPNQDQVVEICDTH